MTDYPYIAPRSYFLIYVYEIPGSVDHAGLLKVGDTSFKSPTKASELTVNCAELAIQVKRWKHNVQAPTVQQVRGSLGAHEQGCIVTTSDFSSGAREEASKMDKAPIALIDGKELINLLMENQVGVRRKEVPLFEVQENLLDNVDQGQ